MQDDHRKALISILDDEIKNKDFIVARAILRVAWRRYKGEEISLQAAQDLLDSWSDTREKIINKTLL